MELEISDKQLTEAVDKIMQKRGYVPANQLIGRTIGLKEFTKKYCYPHGINWVKTHILYEFNPDWVQNIHPGKSGRFAIFEKPAAEWMDKHRKEIDWNHA